ncbi:MAG: hypothetical protein KKH68_09855 [Proteobacteria bacterium]|nr:hypothetical protein [Pseudomonadota bacterium]
MAVRTAEKSVAAQESNGYCNSLSRKKKFKIFTLLSSFCLLYITTRIFLLFSIFQKLDFQEEPHRARLAKDLLEGLVQPLYLYQYTSYDGGSIIHGFFGALMFLCFGESYFSIKMIPLFLSLLSYFFLLIFLYRVYGLRASVLCGALILFPPPTLLVNNLMESDFHGLSFLFAPVLWLLFLTWTKQNTHTQTNKIQKKFNFRSWFILFLMGMLGGIATYYVYTALLATLTVIAGWFAMNRKIFKRSSFLWFCCGYLVGIFPEIAFRVVTHGEPVEQLFFTYSFFSWKVPLLLLENAYNFFRYDWVNATGYFIESWPPSIPLFGYFFIITMVLSMLLYFWLYRSSLLPFIPFTNRSLSSPVNAIYGMLPLVCIFFFTIYIILIKDLLIEARPFFCFPLDGINFLWYRYFSFVTPAFLAIFAIVVAHLARDEKRFVSRLSKALYILTILLGIVSYGSIIKNTERSIKYPFEQKGYFYDIPRLNFFKWTHGDLEQCVSIINSVPDKYHPQLYRGLGEMLNTVFNDLEKTIRTIKTLPPKYHLQLYKGLGSWYASKFWIKSIRLPIPKKALLRLVPQAYHDAVEIGFQETGGIWSYRLRNVWDEATVRSLWKRYHQLKGRNYEPPYSRY